MALNFQGRWLAISESFQSCKAMIVKGIPVNLFCCVCRVVFFASCFWVPVGVTVSFAQQVGLE